MTDFDRKRSKCAFWIHQRRNRVDWWRWTVLTGHNKDPEALNMDERTAFLIFADLVHDGLMVPVVAPDGHEAYTVNPGKETEWQQAMHPWKWWIRHNFARIIEWIVSGIIGGVIGICLGMWWDMIFGK